MPSHSPIPPVPSPHPQAVRDAAESAEAQATWLKEALPRQFTEKLLKQVGDGAERLCTLGSAGIVEGSEQCVGRHIQSWHHKCGSGSAAPAGFLRILHPPSPPPCAHLQGKHMALHIGAADGQPDHAFPHLAGSHLTEQQLVCGAGCCGWEGCNCTSWPDCSDMLARGNRPHCMRGPAMCHNALVLQS